MFLNNQVGKIMFLNNQVGVFGLGANIDLLSVVGSIVHSPEIQTRHFQGTQSGIKICEFEFVVGAV